MEAQAGITIRPCLEARTTKKMIKCGRKAIQEYDLTDKLRDLNLERLNCEGFRASIKFQAQVCQGMRHAMEDSTFQIKLRKGKWLFGVCDGHGDMGTVGKVAVNLCKKNFLSELAKAKGDVKIALTNLFLFIQENLNAQTFGSTMTICYFDGETGLLCTGTLGDSEAFLCREIDDEIYVVPLSYVKTFKCATEYMRLANDYFQKGDVETFHKIVEQYPHGNPSRLRVPYNDPNTKGLQKGLNVSRSFGDKQYGRLISQRPIVTIHQILKKDRVMVVTDGVTKVFNKLQRLKDEVIKPYWNKKMNMAEIVTQRAIGVWGSSDNAAAVVAYFEDKEDEESKLMTPPNSDNDEDTEPCTPGTPKTEGFEATKSHQTSDGQDLILKKRKLDQDD